MDVPVAIDSFIINWIESKALFGDEDAHRDYKKNQYLSYWNRYPKVNSFEDFKCKFVELFRFGPGLVIYWFGYLETIVEPNEKRFMIRDCLPENVVHIPQPIFDMNI